MLRFAHFSLVRRPVFRCAVRGANPKHFDFSKSLESANSFVTAAAAAAAQAGFRDCLQFAFADSDLPI
jgi:hypothetical protein